MSYPVLLGAIRIVANVNDTIEIEEAGVSRSVALTAGTWYLRGDATSDDFCSMLKARMEAAGASANTYTVTPSFSISSSAACASVVIARATGADSISILWASASTTFDESLLGFANSNSTGATSYTSARNPKCVWVGNDVYREFEIGQEIDAWVGKAQSGAVYGGRIGSQRLLATMGFDFITEQRVKSGVGGITNNDFPTFQAYVAAGLPIEIHACAISSGTTLALPASSNYINGNAWWHLDEESASMFMPRRLSPGVPLYSFDLSLVGMV